MDGSKIEEKLGGLKEERGSEETRRTDAVVTRSNSRPHHRLKKTS